MTKEIWTYLETDGHGALPSFSKELIAQAKAIVRTAAGEGPAQGDFSASDLRSGAAQEYRVCALLAGEGQDALESAAVKALCLGAERAIVLEGEELKEYSAEFYADAIGRAVKEEEPSYLLFARTTDGMDLAPRLAAELRTGMISDCVDVEKRDGELLWIRHAFGGTAAVSTAFRQREGTRIVSIRQGSFGGAGRGSDAAAADSPVPDAEGKITFINSRQETGQEKTGRQDIAAGEVNPAGEKIVRPALLQVLEEASDRGMEIGTASVIVAGGNGAGPEGFKLIEELAELLHGAVGASRVAVDKGWISHAHLIGQSGITVTPDLYINCGISGSVQHIVGMRDAKCVISINKDPKALIFNVSDYGIVGDLHKILPALIAEIRRHRG